MKYVDVQQILESAVGGAPIGAHGAFWDTLSRDEFVAYKVFGQIPLIATTAAGEFDPDESNLVKAIAGLFPFGKDQAVPGAKYRRMPAGRAPIDPVDIERIREWIAAGCLE